MSIEISYGKGAVTVYRTYAAPLEGLTAIPESAFTARANTLFAVDVLVEVFGDRFLPAYTEGDNRNVVATDTMKNVILRQALAYEGATMEGFLFHLGRHFLTTYPDMESVRVIGREQPFAAAGVPDAHGFAASSVLWSRSHNDAATATLDVGRNGDDVVITSHTSGRADLQLIKLTGSSFANFARDSVTTLPEVVDRPLFIYLDVNWEYSDPADMIDPTHARYVAAEQVRDVVQVTFHDFVSMSIQHLIYEMGVRLLDRFPQLGVVSFNAQNRLWDTAFVSEADPRIKAYCDPRPPYGLLKLRLPREK